MNTWIVYDSYFGNTEKIARAMAAALGEGAKAAKVADAPKTVPAGTGLLIVGSPIRGFRPTEGIRLYLKNLPDGSLKGIKVAAFDTRISVKQVNNPVLNFFASVFGNDAAKIIAKALVRKGGDLIAPPEGFFVEGSEGPLTDGELERAAKWAAGLQAKS